MRNFTLLTVMDKCSNIKQQMMEENQETSNIIQLPDEILLMILQYSIQDITSYKVIGNICKRFRNIVSDRKLYKSIKISGDTSIEETIAFLRKHGLTIEHLKISNITSELLSEVLREASKFENLQSINIKAAQINWARDGWDLENIESMVRKCEKLSDIKIARKPKEFKLKRLEKHMKQITTFTGLEINDVEWRRILVTSVKCIFSPCVLPDTYEKIYYKTPKTRPVYDARDVMIQFSKGCFRTMGSN